MSRRLPKPSRLRKSRSINHGPHADSTGDPYTVILHYEPVERRDANFMSEVLRNIKLLCALSALALLCAGGSMAVAQTPSGTPILNRALGAFRFKTGARDTVRSNTAQTVVSSASSPL